MPAKADQPVEWMLISADAGLRPSTHAVPPVGAWIDF